MFDNFSNASEIRRKSSKCVKKEVKSSTVRTFSGRLVGMIRFSFLSARAVGMYLDLARSEFDTYLQPSTAGKVWLSSPNEPALRYAPSRSSSYTNVRTLSQFEFYWNWI